MLVLGLTGSIGMGKSATAALFRAEGVPVHDSDAAVHRLYAGPAVSAIQAAFPRAVVAGRVDRRLLSEEVIGNEAALAALERVVHPLVAEDRMLFLERAAARHACVVVEAPLLLETGLDREVDLIVVVDAHRDRQVERVMARPGMTREKFQIIVGRQTPSAEKRRRAHFIVDTNHGTPFAARQVRALMRSLAGAEWA